ncbi:MAG: hypothetical protein ACUVYA_16400 [Planctomycetota bacterium]
MKERFPRALETCCRAVFPAVAVATVLFAMEFFDVALASRNPPVR